MWEQFFQMLQQMRQQPQQMNYGFGQMQPQSMQQPQPSDQFRQAMQMAMRQADQRQMMPPQQPVGGMSQPYGPASGMNQPRPQTYQQPQQPQPRQPAQRGDMPWRSTIRTDVGGVRPPQARRDGGFGS
jgi:hypothetical protein